MSIAAIASNNCVSTRGANSEDAEILRAVCVVLQALAQKYTPESAFGDRTNLVQCIRILKDMGTDVTIKPKYKSFFEEKEIDRGTLAYRVLKNRAIAALSTIADLDKNTADKNQTEYKTGMRDAFKKASNIAIMFLEDIQGEIIDRPENNYPRLVGS